MTGEGGADCVGSAVCGCPDPDLFPNIAIKLSGG
jgi:hypothetical protein